MTELAAWRKSLLGTDQGFPGMSTPPWGQVVNQGGAVQAFYSRLFTPRAFVVPAIRFRVLTAATTNDPVDVGIYDATGKRLTSSGPQLGFLNSQGEKAVPLPAPFVLAPGTVYYLAKAEPASGGTGANLMSVTRSQAEAWSIFGSTFGPAEALNEIPAVPGTLPAQAMLGTPLAPSGVPVMWFRES